MTADSCRRWRGPLAGRALRLADPATDPGLDGHLDGCQRCRAELEELMAVAATAVLADPQRLSPPPLAPALADRIVARIERESAELERRRRKRLLLAVGTVAAAVAAAVAVTIGVIGEDEAGVRRIELAGDAGVDGSATLTERSWGTEVVLEVSGLDPGGVYWLWLADADGERVIAGSLTGTGRPARAVLASALATDDADRIWMTDDDERVVLDAAIT